MKRKNFFKIILTAVIGAGLASFLQSGFWRVDKVECFQNGQGCSFELWSGAFNRLEGRNWIFLAKDRAAKDVENGFPSVASVTVRKKFPKTIKLEVVLRQPSLVLARGDDYYLADGAGVVLGVSKTALGLPLFVAPPDASYRSGEKTDDPMSLFAAELLTECQWRSLRPLKAESQGPRVVTVSFQEGVTAVFSVKKEIGPQLDSLQFILSRTKMEGKLPERVDLRFDKPILKDSADN